MERGRSRLNTVRSQMRMATRCDGVGGSSFSRPYLVVFLYFFFVSLFSLAGVAVDFVEFVLAAVNRVDIQASK